MNELPSKESTRLEYAVSTLELELDMERRPSDERPRDIVRAGTTGRVPSHVSRTFCGLGPELSARARRGGGGGVAAGAASSAEAAASPDPAAAAAAAAASPAAAAAAAAATPGSTWSSSISSGRVTFVEPERRELWWRENMLELLALRSRPRRSENDELSALPKERPLDSRRNRGSCATYREDVARWAAAASSSQGAELEELLPIVLDAGMGLMRSQRYSFMA